MNLMKRLGLLAGMAALSATGCSQSPQIVRGQSPAAQAWAEPVGPIIGTAPGYGETTKHPKKHHDFRPLASHYSQMHGMDAGTMGGGGGNCYADSHGQMCDVGGGGAGCPACNGGMSCPAGGCPHCGFGCGHGGKHPDHYHTYRYNWPQNLVYPTAGVPAGMVQYPYYTLRGPTDFFMK